MKARQAESLCTTRENPGLSSRHHASTLAGDDESSVAQSLGPPQLMCMRFGQPHPETLTSATARFCISRPAS
eukprot:7361695-Prymnesium_polylepis.1